MCRLQTPRLTNDPLETFCLNCLEQSKYSNNHCASGENALYPKTFVCLVYALCCNASGCSTKGRGSN